MPIVSNFPVFQRGGIISLYTVSPNLPEGISLNPLTGVISGTPSRVTPQRLYTITGSNSGGSTNSPIFITVNDQAPTSLSYKFSVSTYRRREEILPNEPTPGGRIDSYSISPPLPAGLVLNPTTGHITGAARASSDGVAYTVMATNTGGSVSTTLVITVLLGQV